MTIRDWLPTAALVTALWAPAVQAVPPGPPVDLSGHWVWDAAKTAALTGRAPAQPLGPVEWTITQTAETLTMDRPWNIGPNHHFVYKMNGSESVNTIGDLVHHTRLQWVDRKAVLSTSTISTAAEAIGTSTSTERFWLTADGGLASERTVVVPGIVRSDGSPSRTTLMGFRREKK